MKKYVLLSLLIASLQVSNAQSTKAGPLVKEKWHFGNAQGQDSVSGYAQAIKAGNVLYISGTVASSLTEEGIRRLYSTLETTLKHYGASFQHVVKENLYTLDIDAMKQLGHVRKEFYKNDFPAATWVQVSRLYTPELKVEIELVAHVPEK